MRIFPNEIKWQADEPNVMIIRNKEYYMTQINMLMKIEGLSFEYDDETVERILASILQDNQNLNGFIWAIKLNPDDQTLFCYISSQDSNKTPVEFYNHFSRLYCYFSSFPRKTEDEVFEQLRLDFLD
ncbi:MAG: hypothetical protein HYI21_10040 [Sediminibacterium sp. Gen4]|jgi:hypothetical protein|uniref:hypothetical protein n=1 Tax=unclassified Sediminibacterium TaxID=2635961 RepID=UPI0015BEE72A|nr:MULTISPECIES: hypothetical protein [unclassified Sediminibacterium]MBW0160417.1 hypothetical protein [Sediminibacterium sp.]MBW0163040.1 hypothetical protein [Sediminibacterium sp.]NWK66358.1 hypothetical protein [Sediminibacterium sp. Gen4]